MLPGTMPFFRKPQHAYLADQFLILAVMRGDFVFNGATFSYA
jgi:hypothetical protein